MVAVTEKYTKRRAKPKVTLEDLVYETFNGKPLYYSGYKEVLAGKKTKEEIMSCSSLQGVLVSLLNGILFGLLNRKKYLLSYNEFGIHISKGENLGIDLAIFEKERIAKLTEKYFDIPPKIVIEVDIKAEIELADFPAKEMDYIFEKSQKLLDFGAEKVIWVTTHSRKVIIAAATQTWVIVDWHTDFEIMEGCVLNIKQLLDEEGVEY